MDRGSKGNAQKDKIFYLIRPASGGMRRHLQQLIRRFSRDYALHLGAPPDHEMTEPAGFPAGSFYELPLGKGLSPVGDLSTFRRLYRLLCAVRPAFLHIHGFKAALPGLPAARLARVPVLITVHNYPAHRGSPYLSAAGGLAGAQQDRYIAVSHALAGELAARGIPREKISVIHNGIEPGPFEAAAARFRRCSDQLVVGTAARFAPQKGLSYFIEAAAVLAPLFPRMHFLIIGDGPGRHGLEKLARQLDLPGRLSFCGYCADLPRRLAGIDIFVLPSLTEGFSLTLLEAAAAGCSLVASQVGGAAELITGGVHGLLVPPADVTALARAIASLARDPALAQRLAGACRERVKAQFNLKRTLSKTASLYEELVGETHRGAPEPVASAAKSKR
ncbi:MAG: glycosyltransferase family 4 protein [Firmicutes bacterium]|nr:glycosyltransferase family 4 protein [Bacillota bacterium]